MIPRIIHYCWFGKNPIPEEYLKYMESWKLHCPDFQIKEWNEDNFDVTENEYCKEAYEAKKWAFVSDYARLKVIYEQGGIYLDTDVEVLKSLTPLISDGVGFSGFQNNEEVATGLGFAAEAGNPCVGKLLELYENRHFKNEEGKLDLTPCPVINTVALKCCGLKTGKKATQTIQKLEGMKVLPIEYLNPLNSDTQKVTITENTYLFHHYSASWNTEGQKRMRKLKKFIPNFLLSTRANYISKRDVKEMEEKFGLK